MAAPALGGLAVDTARLRLHLEQQFADSPGVVSDHWTWDSSIFSSRTESFTLRPPVAGSSADFVADVRGMYDQYSGAFLFTAKAWLNNDENQAGTVGFSYNAQNDSLRIRARGQSTALLAGVNAFTVQNASATQSSRRPLAFDSFDVLYWTALSLDPGLGQLDFARWATRCRLRAPPPTCGWPCRPVRNRSSGMFRGPTRRSCSPGRPRPDASPTVCCVIRAWIGISWRPGWRTC